jgi:hypothetical protein
MALWNKLRDELDRAGRVAQGAIDEGKIRLEAFRARQLADRAAQALGYAVYRARQQGQELDTDTYARLSSALAAHEADVTRREAQVADLISKRRGARASSSQPPAAPEADASPPADPGAAGSAGSAGSTSTASAPPPADTPPPTA